MRGGRRIGAGRRSVLNEGEKRRVGQACDRVWYWLRSHRRRPYDFRSYVELSAAVFYSREFDRHVSMRRIQAAWKHARSLGLARAQPLELAYADASSIDDWLNERMERGYRDSLQTYLDQIEWTLK